MGLYIEEFNAIPDLLSLHLNVFWSYVTVFSSRSMLERNFAIDHRAASLSLQALVCSIG